MEQDALVYLGLIALVGIVLKLTILFSVSIKSKISECFAMLCLFFLLQNVAEFLGFFTYSISVELGAIFVHMYMITLFFIFPSLMVLALALVEYKHLKLAKIVFYGISVIISAAYAAGYVVEGVKFVGWSAITTPGQYYWIAVAYPVLMALSAVVVLAKHFLANSSFKIRERCKVNLLALAPMVLLIIGVLAFRAAGFESSTAIAMPLATIFFLFVMLLQTNENIFWASLRLKIILSVLTLKKINTLDEILGNIEKLRITEALRASNGMQRNAAKLLSIPPSTLNKKIAKYEICAEDFQRVSFFESLRTRRQLPA